MSSWLSSLHPALLPDHWTPKCTILGAQSYPGEAGFLFSGEHVSLGSGHASFRTPSCWEFSSLGLLFLLPGLLVTARSGKSLQLKYWCSDQWSVHSPQVTHLPAAFGTHTLKSAKQLASVMMKESCRTTTKYLVNAGRWHSKHAAKRNSLCFSWIRHNRTVLTKLYSHHFPVAVIAQDEGRHYTSGQLEKAAPVIYVATW